MEGGEHAEASPAKNLQDAVCARLTKDGALDSLRRKLIEHTRNEEALNAKLQQLLAERCQARDLEGLESKPKAARKKIVDDIKSQVLKELRGDAQRMLWHALSGEGSDIAQELEVRVLEALCSITEDEQRQWAEEQEQARAARREQRRREREALAQQQQQQYMYYQQQYQQQQYPYHQQHPQHQH